MTHEIDIRESPPIRQAHHHVPFSLRPKIEQTVKEILKTEVISRIAHRQIEGIVVRTTYTIISRFLPILCLHTDASGQDLGAVLEQRARDAQMRPVAYASCTLSKHKKNYGIMDLKH